MTPINSEWMRLEQTQVQRADDMERSIVIIARLELSKRPSGGDRRDALISSLSGLVYSHQRLATTVQSAHHECGEQDQTACHGGLG